jgi:hypothetical protein
MSTVVERMKIIRATRRSARRRVNFARGVVLGLTCTGSLQEYITCVG